MYPPRRVRPEQQMPRCLDSPVGLSEFITEIHTTEKLLVELIGPDLAIYRGAWERDQDPGAEILEMNPRSPVSVCVM